VDGGCVLDGFTCTVLKDADAGRSSKALAERYHVSRAWVDALKQRRRETGAITPRFQTKFRGRVLAGQEERLVALITARPDATLAELRAALPTPAGLSTLWRTIGRLGFTFKKIPMSTETPASVMKVVASPRRAGRAKVDV
jgi:transposase